MSTINLLPQDYIDSQRRHRANFVCAVLFALVMAGISSAALICERQRQNLDELRERVQAAHDEATRLITEMQQLEDQRQILARRWN